MNHYADSYVESLHKEIYDLEAKLKRVEQIGDKQHTITIPDFIDTDDTEQLDAFESGAFAVIHMIAAALNPAPQAATP